MKFSSTGPMSLGSTSSMTFLPNTSVKSKASTLEVRWEISWDPVHHTLRRNITRGKNGFFFLNKRRTFVFMKCLLCYVDPSQRLPKIVFLYTRLKVGIFFTNLVTELTTSLPFTLLNPLVYHSH